MNSNKENERFEEAYLNLRWFIGILGMALPFVLFFGGLILFQTGLQISLSDYYNTGMGSWFVGTLFATGAFLYSYKDRYKKDPKSTDGPFGYLACGFAIGVAIFPTPGLLHGVCTFAFFGTLIYFSLVLFVKSDKEKPYKEKKRHRNRVYRICGWTMVICMLGIFIVYSLDYEMAWWKPVFWLEAVAIEAFAVSWFTKGDGIRRLNDEELPPK